MNKLSRLEFAMALKKGQGRALNQIINFGIEEFKDLVLEACLHDQNFDSQIDSSRAPWLFSMFHTTPFYESFRDSIINALKTSESWDFVQLCNLLREMSLTSDNLARERLKETVFAYATYHSGDEYIIAETFVSIQTPDEFLELAKIYGNRLLKNENSFPFENLIPETNKEVFKNLLCNAAKADLSIQRYWQYLSERGYLEDSHKSVDIETIKKNHHEQVRRDLSLDQILQNAQDKNGDFPGQYGIFGKHATKEELEIAYNSLIAEKDPQVQIRLLSIFSLAALPELNDTILSWAFNPDFELRGAAIKALSHVQHEKIHKLAQEKINKLELHGPDSEVIGLFHKNYDISDAKLITKALYSIEANEGDTHSLGIDLILLSKEQSDPHLSESLKWVYENTPCMECRYEAVVQLNRFNKIDEQILEEIKFDANEDIRNLQVVISQ